MKKTKNKLTLETALTALDALLGSKTDTTQPVAAGTRKVKYGLAQMMKGGTIMDVTNAEQAKIAEEAGACSVMALERVPSDIRKQGGVARMSPVKKVKEIQATVSIPVMAKVRIGHFVEAQILESLKVDFIDESEVLTPADPWLHINKEDFKVPFVCGATNLGEALRRINEGAAMIRTKGEAGTGNIIEAVRHLRQIAKEIGEIQRMNTAQMKKRAAEYRVPVQLVELTANLGRIPVVNFAAGGVATPADAALCMQLGCDGVFVGSGIFKSKDPATTARAIVQAVAQYNNVQKVTEASFMMGDAMDGLEIGKLETKLAERGW